MISFFGLFGPSGLVGLCLGLETWYGEEKGWAGHEAGMKLSGCGG